MNTTQPSKPKRWRRIRRPMFIAALVLVGTWLVFGGFLWIQPEDSTPTASADSGANPETYHTVTLPLNDGKCSLGELLATVVDELGMDGGPIRRTANLNLNMQGFLGKSAVEIIEKTGVVSIETNDDAMVIKVDRIRIRRSRRELHADLRAFIEKMFPEEAAKALSRHGLFVHQPDGTRDDPASVTLPEHVVVLIHGLDEPGRLWHALIPALHEAGFMPIEVRYPNDQAIADSAEALAVHLKSLRAQGVKRISIMSHSMGGLVSREVLTSPIYYGGNAQGHEEYPDVDRFIMIGTPNQGSALARVRAVTEVRDQIVQLFSGDGMLFGGFFDGAGEAQADLLPESPFLTALNARPLPENVKISIIAGIASPVKPGMIDGLALQLARMTPDGTNGLISDLREGINGVVAGVGDGCVSIASTRLDGVEDHVSVSGNHLTMIRNQLLSSDRVPPAVPVILDRLNSDRNARDRP